MSISFDLKATVRNKLGSAESRRIRKSGNIPASINNGGDNVEISISSREFEREYLKGNIFTTLINLDIEGKSQKVIVDDLYLNPVTDKPSHISFMKAEEGSKVKALVKVSFFNREKSPGIKRGGFLHITARKIKLLCPIEAIPQEIAIDIGKMKVGQKIVSADIELPQNVSFVNKKEFNVASIIGRGSKEEEAEDATEAQSTDPKAGEKENS